MSRLVPGPHPPRTASRKSWEIARKRHWVLGTILISEKPRAASDDRQLSGRAGLMVSSPRWAGSPWLKKEIKFSES